MQLASMVRPCGGSGQIHGRGRLFGNRSPREKPDHPADFPRTRAGASQFLFPSTESVASLVWFGKRLRVACDRRDRLANTGTRAGSCTEEPLIVWL